MESSTYEIEADVEAKHWWFVGRRKLLGAVISELHLPIEATVLDIGTSTGTNLRLLRDLGFVNYEGVDLSDDAIRWCADKGLGIIKKGDICNLSSSSESFDLVLATDVIEHVDNDYLALHEIKRVLRKNGVAIITVPAFQSLWGLQDEVAHHKRRYSLKQLKGLIRDAGMKCDEVFYFNYLLFFPIWITRKLIRIINIKLESENQINTNILNYVLKTIFIFDVFSARRIKPMFGVSILAVIRER